MIYLFIYAMGALFTAFGILVLCRYDYEESYKESCSFIEYLENNDYDTMIIYSTIAWPAALAIGLPIYSVKKLFEYLIVLSGDVYKYLNKQE